MRRASEGLCAAAQHDARVRDATGACDTAGTCGGLERHVHDGRGASVGSECGERAAHGVKARWACREQSAWDDDGRQDGSSCAAVTPCMERDREWREKTRGRAIQGRVTHL